MIMRGLKFSELHSLFLFAGARGLLIDNASSYVILSSFPSAFGHIIEAPSFILSRIISSSPGLHTRDNGKSQLSGHN